MRQYAPFYLWAIVIAVLAFGLGIRIGSTSAYDRMGFFPAHHQFVILDWFRS